MSDDFTFDGVSSSEFDTYLASSNFLDGAARDVSMVPISGRNGDLIVDNNRYNNFPLIENLYITGDVINNADQLRNYLGTHADDYYRIEESQYPDIYRMARFTGQFTMGVFDHNGGAVSVEYDCRPEKYLISGDTAINVSASTTKTIMNPTAHASKPLIKVTGVGTFTVNGESVKVTVNAGNLMIDCEKMDCYEYVSGNLTNRNLSVELPDDFFVFKAGNNTIVTPANMTLEIKPRWWMQ